jgi:hypothetical protein
VAEKYNLFRDRDLDNKTSMLLKQCLAVLKWSMLIPLFILVMSIALLAAGVLDACLWLDPLNKRQGNEAANGKEQNDKQDPHGPMPLPECEKDKHRPPQE